MLEFCADTKEVGIMVEATRMAKPERNMITGCQMGGIKVRSSDLLGKLARVTILIEYEVEDNIRVMIEIPSLAVSLQAGR